MTARRYRVRLPLVGDVPGRECAGRRRPGHRDRQRAAAVVRRARRPRRREGPARTGRAAQRRADLRRLRAQAGCAGEDAGGAAALCEAQARSSCSAAAATAIPGKRPMMGAIAAEGADGVIVTDDNPRSEEARRDPRRHPGGGARRDRDRRPRARRSSAPSRTLQTGDVLVMAGKGHETGQIVGDQSAAVQRPRGGRRRAARRRWRER